MNVNIEIQKGTWAGIARACRCLCFPSNTSDAFFCHGWLGKADSSKGSAYCVLCLLHTIHLLMMSSRSVHIPRRAG